MAAAKKQTASKPAPEQEPAPAETPDQPDQPDEQPAPPGDVDQAVEGEQPAAVDTRPRAGGHVLTEDRGWVIDDGSS